MGRVNRIATHLTPNGEGQTSPQFMNTIDQLNKVILTRTEWAAVLEFTDTAESLAQEKRRAGNDEQVKLLLRARAAREIYEKISTQVSMQTKEASND